MNGLVKGGLALGGLVLGLGALRRALNPTPRYAPWEKPPYGEFENKVLVVGGVRRVHGGDGSVQADREAR